MYAVIVTGGKQYKVAQGDCLRVEKIEAEVGDKVFGRLTSERLAALSSLWSGDDPDV